MSQRWVESGAGEAAASVRAVSMMSSDERCHQRCGGFGLGAGGQQGAALSQKLR